MRLSIITVCYNCESEIRKTLDSVSNQIDNNFEYIIVDGKSADKTLDIVNEYKNIIDNMIVISEEDQGIYDAMNKGVRSASGEYILFLNGGDVFYNADVTSKIMNLLQRDYDVIYGNIVTDGKIIRYDNYNLFDLIYLGRTICHQAIFAKRDLLLRVPFDTEYMICADRDWLIKMFKMNKKIYYANDLVVAVYDTTGISSTSPLLWEEKLEIIKKHGTWFAYYLFMMKSWLANLIRK